MAKHVEGQMCPSCDEKLLTAHPELARWFHETVKPKFKDAHVSWAFRDKVCQNQAYAEGKTKAPWPKSFHNKTGPHDTPCAQAIDLFQLCSNGMAAWPWAWFKKIAETCKTDNIVWGGSFKSISDADHFEIHLEDTGTHSPKLA